MEVIFQSRRLERCFDESSRAVRAWGHDVGRRYVRRVNELRALSRFDDLFRVRQFRAHWLHSRRRDCALDLVGRWRLIVRRGARDDQVIVREVSNHYDD